MPLRDVVRVLVGDVLALERDLAFLGLGLPQTVMSSVVLPAPLAPISDDLALVDIHRHAIQRLDGAV